MAGVYIRYPATGGGGGGTVTSVTASTPLSSSGGTTPNITIQTASGSQAGALSAADWTTFNSKQAALGYTPVNKAGDTMTGILQINQINDLANTPSYIVSSRQIRASSGVTTFDGEGDQINDLSAALSIDANGRTLHATDESINIDFSTPQATTVYGNIQFIGVDKGPNWNSGSAIFDDGSGAFEVHSGGTLKLSDGGGTIMQSDGNGNARFFSNITDQFYMSGQIIDTTTNGLVMQVGNNGSGAQLFSTIDQSGPSIDFSNQYTLCDPNGGALLRWISRELYSIGGNQVMQWDDGSGSFTITADAGNFTAYAPGGSATVNGDAGASFIAGNGSNIDIEAGNDVDLSAISGSMSMTAAGTNSVVSSASDVYIDAAGTVHIASTTGPGAHAEFTTTTFNIADYNGSSIFSDGSNNLTLSPSAGTKVIVTKDLSVTGSVSIGSTITTVNGSTSGTAKFSQPEQGSSSKEIIIYCTALLGTASYTFPTAFTNTPAILTTNGLAASVVTSLSTTAVTLTGVTSTGHIFLKGR